MWHVPRRRDRHTGFCGKPDGKRLLGRPKQRIKDDVKMNPNVVGWKALTELTSLRTGTSDRLLLES
jgi:hypothetical protein